MFTQKSDKEQQNKENVYWEHKYASWCREKENSTNSGDYFF